MAEKDDLQNLGGDVGPPQHRFLLVLFSGPLDIVPWSGIGSAPPTLSNDAVDNIFHGILFRLLTVSAPANGRDINN